MRKSLFAASMLALSVAIAPACATKKFVKTEVGNVNSKVDTLSGTVEETQERTRQNETRIGQVDQKAEAAGRSAQDARATADSAVSMAKDVDNKVAAANQHIDLPNWRVASGETEVIQALLRDLAVHPYLPAP